MPLAVVDGTSDGPGDPGHNRFGRSVLRSSSDLLGRRVAALQIGVIAADADRLLEGGRLPFDYPELLVDVANLVTELFPRRSRLVLHLAHGAAELVTNPRLALGADDHEQETQNDRTSW